MIWAVATLLLAAGGVYALWPLARHWQARPQPGAADLAGEAELEELALDVAAGRVSEAEAAERRQQLRP